MLTDALILAGGTGERWGGNKIFHLLPEGEPIIVSSLKTLGACESIRFLLVVLHRSYRERFDEVLSILPTEVRAKCLPPVEGGATRGASCWQGLKGLGAYKPEAVLIHDAVRPFVCHKLLRRLLEALKTEKGVVPVLPVWDALKLLKGKEVGESLKGTLLCAQTPQVFLYQDILASYEKISPSKALRDDGDVFQRAGGRIRVVQGCAGNRKLTTPQDLFSPLLGEVRTGIGIDVHPFHATEGEGHLILGGCKIPHRFSLQGHSDADVLLHAVVDSVLGAAGAGDIGTHFPPSDSRWKNQDSSLFVTFALKMAAERGFRLSSLDMTVVCEHPKLSRSFREEVCKRVGLLCQLSVDKVNVKATTTEGLGFTGRKEGVMAVVIATLRGHCAC